mmetsp:Transcript_26564/g.39433  ORF Transcript_26564/g.39433 Transcript_26564/m.39433 type:complete len:97 (-) Transcript_26564:169-459(-)
MIKHSSTRAREVYVIFIHSPTKQLRSIPNIHLKSTCALVLNYPPVPSSSSSTHSNENLAVPISANARHDITLSIAMPMVAGAGLPGYYGDGMPAVL